MRTVTCDRCGKKLFKERNRGNLYGKYYASRGFYGDVWFKKLFGNRSIIVDVDLCENCADELAKWLHIDDNNSGDA